MSDVARLAGVSVTTVSFVVNERPDTGLRDQTKARVRAAIAELGYQPNFQARSLARRSSQTIGLVAAELGTPYAGRIISGAHDLARERDCMLLILDAEEPAELGRCVAELQARGVDGIIVATEGTTDVHLPPEVSRRPTVLVNCLAVGAVPGILPDDEAGGHAAARMLIDAGHREIACLAGDPKAWATKMRVRGFRAAVAEAGSDVHLLPVRFGDYGADSGYRLCTALMQRRRRPTAIFMGNDRMALGAYFALAELGLRVPEDVSVVGYDDQEGLADGMRPALTTIRLPFYEMGRLAAQHVLAATVDGLDKRTLVTCPPVLRGSVGVPALGAHEVSASSRALPA